MKVSKRDILLLIGFLGILVGVCSYLFVFQPTMEKADALEQENMQLQSRISDLKSKQANKETYESETVKMEQEMKEIYQLFPVDVREENAILLAINQELVAPLKVESVTIDALLDVPFLDSVPEEETQISYEIDAVEELEDYEGTQQSEEALTVGGEDGSGGLNPYGLKSRKVTMTYEISYEALKRSVKNICLQTDRMVIDNMTVVYDESTGLLHGTTAVNMYCVPNQEGKEYVQPNFSSVLLGTDNIFGTIVIRSESGLGDLEGAEGEGGEEAEE
ncbi:MAG: hypothetical protein HFI62_04290 [Lachnospiraceae bacterium]|nr:hypothetical protein [Lachnospiraceae bacterium]